MILSQGYTWTDGGDVVTVVWTSVGMPEELRFVVRAVLALLPFLVFFAGPAARTVARWGRRPVSPRSLAVAAPAISIFLAGSLLFDGRPLVAWRFDDEGLRLRSRRGEVALRWSAVSSARWIRPSRASGETLVLTGTDGREAWVATGWLAPVHRAHLLRVVERGAPNVFRSTDQNQ